MNKICTTIEQSKKLIELGLDVNTADMMWDDWELIGEGWKLSVGYYPEIERNYGRKCYPAWSINALLRLIPIVCVLSINNKRYRIASNDRNTLFYEDPLDAVFEMIVWLKENGKI